MWPVKILLEQSMCIYHFCLYRYVDGVLCLGGHNFLGTEPSTELYKKHVIAHVYMKKWQVFSAESVVWVWFNVQLGTL